MTTDGYGDSDPTTAPGRVIAIAVMAVGMGVVAVLTAAAAERFTRVRREEAADLAAVHARLDEILRRSTPSTSDVNVPARPRAR